MFLKKNSSMIRYNIAFPLGDIHFAFYMVFLLAMSHIFHSFNMPISHKLLDLMKNLLWLPFRLNGLFLVGFFVLIFKDRIQVEFVASISSRFLLRGTFLPLEPILISKHQTKTHRLLDRTNPFQFEEKQPDWKAYF